MIDTKYIKQKELADINGVKSSYISQLVKQGIFRKCFKGKKLLRDCALSAYINAKDPSRDSQREHHRLSRLNINQYTDKEIKENINQYTDKEIKESDLFTSSNIEELDEYLKDAKNANSRVQIIKDYWIGKLNEQKYLENDKKLIPRDVIVKDIQRILKAFRDKTLALPTKMTSALVSQNDKKIIAKIIEDFIYELLEELSSLEDEEALIDSI